MATLVCFHAHPDDEVISTGGTIARAAAEGHRVVLVVATNGDHGEGVVTAVFGKYVKQAASFMCDGNARFNPATTPGVDAHWAAIAAALKCPGNPFGANPHAILA